MFYINSNKLKTQMIYYFISTREAEIKQVDNIRYQCVYDCQVDSVVSNSVQPYGLQPIRLLCPWDSPGKNTGVGFCACLQDKYR